MGRKAPEDWHYPGGRWLPTIIGVFLVLMAIGSYMAGAPLVVVSIDIGIAAISFVIQIEYEMHVGVFS